MLYRLYYVRCDGCGKPCGTTHDLTASGTAARQIAKKRGWLRVPKRSGYEGGSPGADYCPQCIERQGDA